MKKFFAIMLAMLLVLMSFAALAEGTPDGEIPDLGDKVEGAEKGPTRDGTSNPSIKKTYTTTGTATDVYPTEALAFTVTPDDDSYPEITVGTNNAFSVDGTAAEYDILVNVPDTDSYSGAGRYHYTVKEDTPTAPSQAVVYDTEKVFNVDVYIYRKIVDGKVTDELDKTVVIYSGEDQKGGNAESDAKNDTFANTYSVGELKVTKKISGNLADPDKEFTIEIKLTSENSVANEITIDATNATSVEGSGTKGWKSKVITFTAKGGQYITISNIPTGVTYTIEETDITKISSDKQLENANVLNAYTVTGEVAEADNKAIGTELVEETITNTKEITIPTGIALDTVPYMIILAVALFSLVALVSRKRREF